jgi:hypothetical protein
MGMQCVLLRIPTCSFDKDDDEADSIYEAIEERQDERRRAHRERYEKEQLLKLRKERPKIQQQFADLKRQLTDVSAEVGRPFSLHTFHRALRHDGACARRSHA